MNWFFIVSSLTGGVILCWALVVLVLFIVSNRKAKTASCNGTKKCATQFRVEVEESYQKQIKLVNDGDIKMNILTNDSDGDNEIRIMNNFKRLIQSPMFDVVVCVKGDLEI